jgi:hypothetical protein
VARDIRAGPLANQRLVASTQGEGTFRYRINRDTSDRKLQSLLPLSLAEFIRRSLLHVPEPGTMERTSSLCSDAAALAPCPSRHATGTPTPRGVPLISRPVRSKFHLNGKENTDV